MTKSVRPLTGPAVVRARVRSKHTISQAKNRMRRTVEEILDPGPTNIDPLWEHFGHSCAYCGRELSRLAREAHVDHAVSGGGNHLGNLILACARCNGDEKREQPWREFLKGKATDAAFSERERRILAWLGSPPTTIVADSPEISDVRADLETLIRLFGEKCTRLKVLVADEATPLE